MKGWFVQQAVEGLLEAAMLLGFGYLLADAVIGRRELGAAVKWALAFPSLVAFALLLMLAHIATGGLVFSQPWVVRALTGAAAVLLLARAVFVRREPGARFALGEALPVLAMIGLALVVWGYPILRLVPPAGGGDLKWHMGWASQLMTGETTPSTIVTGAVPNYYPWMFHALVAWLAAFTPRGHAYNVLPALQMLQLSAIVLGLFALGKTLGKTRLAGAATALFGALAGGPLLRP
ncbi:MAG TPA: hypothetical protein VF660_06830, partial [Actinomycetota bacterium]